MAWNRRPRGPQAARTPHSEASDCFRHGIEVAIGRLKSVDAALAANPDAPLGESVPPYVLRFLAGVLNEVRLADACREIRTAPRRQRKAVALHEAYSIGVEITPLAFHAEEAAYIFARAVLNETHPDAAAVQELAAEMTQAFSKGMDAGAAARQSPRLTSFHEAEPGSFQCQ